ncbi:MAG: hypothetical protein HQL16_02265 [Candidatus Omnitrophica bacterium]|nr:hypothetical protein [Candidatus Omnitrophota bacterium]
MIKRILILVFFFFAIGIYSSFAEESFQTAARRALDEYEKNHAEAIDQVSSSEVRDQPFVTDGTVSQPPPVVYSESFFKSSQPAGDSATAQVGQPSASSDSDAQQVKEQFVKSVASAQERRNIFEFGFEGYTYRYRETVEGQHFMDNKGAFQAVYGSWLHRLQNPEKSAEMPGIFKADLRLGMGSVDYNGGVQDNSGNQVADLTASGIKDTVVETRGVFGKEMPWHGFLFMPYAGLGYRYLKDRPDQVSSTFTYQGVEYTISGYKRISQYWYLPVGIDVQKNFPNKWGVGTNLEYDQLLKGTQRSYEQTPTEPFITNTQKHGYGVRGSIRISRDFNNMTLNFEPFFRYWDIDKSDVVLTGCDAGGCYGAQEPLNVTREIGVKLGIKF